MTPAKGRKGLTGVRWSILVLAAALAFSLASPARAEDIFSLSEKLTKGLPDRESRFYGDWVEQFRRSSSLLGDKKKELSLLDLSLAAGFNGDQAGDQSLYKLSLDAAVNKTVYPRAVRFRAGTSVQYRNKVLQEDVTTLVLNFDYYFAPWLETYAFVERFSDTFLSIKQRYEVGGGLKLELNLFDTPGNSEEKSKKELLERAGAQSLGEYESYLARLEREGGDKAGAQSLRLLLDAYRAERRSILAGLRQKEAMLSLGLALSVFSEMEQAEFSTTLLQGGVSQPFKFSLDSGQRFRFVVRPNLVVRPLDVLSIKGHIYWKLPLGGVTRPGGQLDYRTDSLVSAELRLPTDPEWGKKVSLIVEYQRHYQNVPPRIPQSVVDTYLAAEAVIGQTVAERAHDIYAFKVGITF